MPKTEPAVTPDPANTLVEVGVKRDPNDFRIYLVVNAKPLHDILDKIGVPVQNGRYINRPAAGYAVMNNVGHLSTEVFLRREYPVRVPLADVMTTPPTPLKLRESCSTAQAAIRQILEHYQPIDIQITIQKRVIV
jgi:hypothetical protein